MNCKNISFLADFLNGMCLLSSVDGVGYYDLQYRSEQADTLNVFIIVAHLNIAFYFGQPMNLWYAVF